MDISNDQINNIDHWFLLNKTIVDLGIDQIYNNDCEH